MCEQELCTAIPAIASAFNWIPVAAAAPIAVVLTVVCRLVYKKKKRGKK